MKRALAVLALCVATVTVAAAEGEMPADLNAEIGRLVGGIEARIAELRQKDRQNPEAGLGAAVDKMEARVKQLRATSFGAGSNMFGDAAAYVSVGNSVYVTPNFFSSMYSDAEREAILLHEADHLGQSLFEKKLQFWGSYGEIDAYKEEYLWLNLLGAGAAASGSKYEIFNVLQALRQDYHVITADDKVQALEEELGLTPALLALLYPHTRPQTGDPSTGADKAWRNNFFTFSVPAEWEVKFGDPASSQERYAFLTKVTERRTNWGATVTFGARITLGEVLGADFFNPGVEKMRNEEMRKDEQLDFSGGDATRTFSAMSRAVAGENGLGYRKVVTTTNADDPPKVMITEKIYFKKGRKYYYIELFYDEAHKAQVLPGYNAFLQSLEVKP